MQPSAARMRHLGPALALLATVIIAAPGAAESTKCQDTIVREGARYRRTAEHAHLKCELARLRGRIETGTDCASDATTVARIQQARARLERQLGGACGGTDGTCGTPDDDSLSGIRWDIGTCPAACGGAIADCTDIAACLACHADAALALTMGTVFGAFAPDPERPVLRCQEAIGRAVARFFTSESNLLRDCQTDVVRNGRLGPCPDSGTAARIARAEARKVRRICKACGGRDRSCGTADDRTPTEIGFVATCPARITPDDAESCAQSVATLTDLVTCVDCVADAAVQCAAAVAAPAVGVYPAVCGGPSPTPVPSPSPTLSATATVTVSPTPTFTPSPSPTATVLHQFSCGNGIVEPGEDCDPPGASLCPNAGNGLQICTTSCFCPCPRALEFETDPNAPATAFQPGWTGRGHATQLLDGVDLTFGVTACNDGTLDPFGRRNPSCGVCDLSIIPNLAGGAGTVDNERCACDPSVRCGADTDCPGACPCAVFAGAPLPLAIAGPVTEVATLPITPACILNHLDRGLIGSVEIETNAISAVAHLTSTVFPGTSEDTPCPTCIGDVLANDGGLDGTCAGGLGTGLPCDVNGVSPSPTLNGGAAAPGTVNGVSLDCLPAAPSVGTLRLRPALTTGNDGITLTSEHTSCTALGPGFDRKCACDTCATAAAEPCQTDADCPSASTCGGRRCLGGTMAGTPCEPDPIPILPHSVCGFAACAVPGEPTLPNPCLNIECMTPGLGVDDGCFSPFDGRCHPRETYRACLLDSDCPIPGDTCVFASRPCFADDGIVGASIAAKGSPDSPVNDTATPTLAATFCIPPLEDPNLNELLGLPGPGRLVLTGVMRGRP